MTDVNVRPRGPGRMLMPYLDLTDARKSEMSRVGKSSDTHATLSVMTDWGLARTTTLYVAQDDRLGAGEDYDFIRCPATLDLLETSPLSLDAILRLFNRYLCVLDSVLGKIGAEGRHHEFRFCADANNTDTDANTDANTDTDANTAVIRPDDRPEDK
jgi:hypothetical protein